METPTGGGVHEQRNVLWAHKECEYHKEVLEYYSKTYGLGSDDFYCLGGGYINVSPSNQTIKVWGESCQFGKPDYKTVQDMLQTAYPGWKISCEDR